MERTELNGKKGVFFTDEEYNEIVALFVANKDNTEKLYSIIAEQSKLLNIRNTNLLLNDGGVSV